MKSVFSRIIGGELPCKRVFENERVIAFMDIHPVAPVHVLIVSKKPYESVQSIPKEELGIVGEMVGVAQDLAAKYGIESGYRLLTNCGEEAGQTVFHLHFHLIGGRKLGPLA